MPAANPGLDVATYLAADATLSLALGTTVFNGPVRPTSAQVPERAVFCLASGGPAPQPYLDGGAEAERIVAVQIRVRGAPGDWDGARTLAVGCRDRMHQKAATIARSIGGTYLDSLVREDQPLYLGTDSQGCHEFSVNVELWHDE
jgi:hypothetical protein